MSSISSATNGVLSSSQESKSTYLGQIKKCIERINSLQGSIDVARRGINDSISLASSPKEISKLANRVGDIKAQSTKGSLETIKLSHLAAKVNDLLKYETYLKERLELLEKISKQADDVGLSSDHKSSK